MFDKANQLPPAAELASSGTPTKLTTADMKLIVVLLVLPFVLHGKLAATSGIEDVFSDCCKYSTAATDIWA